eukprot:TRINITY_DN33328_c0_g1_i1.p1 TRINITY_DN33328_c0_g1~~TRINITY_DN33328_c0_g1_i1.p1  ORF type:complete len:1174 (+),score=312.87 TRINITY_DN33328_c0_g1_i1:164-3685(+)
MAEKGGGAECVKVAIRCRPPSQKEKNNNEECIVEMREAFGDDGDSGQVVLSDPDGKEEPATFAFDIVFGLSIQQYQIFESVGNPALMKTFEGFNGTIFAYGQTGSGKSWSMSGGPGELQGIIPRVNAKLFEEIAEKQSNSTRRFLVMCSFFEIYNEIIFDLLNPVADRSKIGGGLQIKEHPVMGIYVKDLTEIMAEDASKMETLLENGNKARAVSSTMMNSTSSRSHSIFTIKIHQKDDDDPSRNVFAKLNLVDLAGSERQKGTGASGQTLKEGANINKSLSALGNVINALVESANGKKVFIPYRNSKLTRVLQESLGGNSLCTMLATLSPAACNYEETMSTLRYANRAKAIKVSATKNEEASQISRLKEEVEQLKQRLAAGNVGGGCLTEEDRQAEKAKFERQLKDMERMMSNNWEEKAKLSQEHERQMLKLREERQRAAQALEEERSKRLRMLQEQGDLELSLRGLLDLVTSLAKISNPPAVLTGDLPRQWLKTYRVFRQNLDALTQQTTLVMVFKHAFDEAVQLWGEGAEAQDVMLMLTGLKRCLPKLDKLRKGGEKLLQLEGESFSDALEVDESVQKSMVELDAFRQARAAEEGSEPGQGEEPSEEASPSEAGKANDAALEQVSKMLSLIKKQVEAKIDELGQLASVEIGQTCAVVLQNSEGCLAGAAEETRQHCQTLRALIADPGLAAMPAGMPAKPLYEYEPHEVQDTPVTTDALLRQLIRWEGVVGKTKKSASDLLARPPPKFIHDVAVAVKKVTGFPPGLEENWPENRDDRLVRFEQMRDAVCNAFGIHVDFDGVDVLKGKEVSKTLRLMQLLAVAADRSRSPDARSAQRAEGVAKASELPAMLDAMDKCIQAARSCVEIQHSEAAAAKGDEERSLDEKISALETQLSEESRKRLAQEQALAKAERALQEAKAAVRTVSNECERTRADSLSGQDAEQVELERQLEQMRQRAEAPADASDQGVIQMLEEQLEGLRKEIEQGAEDVSKLEERRAELQTTLADVQAQTRRIEAEVQRERAKRETDQELIGQSPEEQKVILQAHESKLRLRTETLEGQIKQMQTETEEHRAVNKALQSEKEELTTKTEETSLEIQIVQEERDGLREAMENLWNEKAIVDDELETQMAGYVNLSERLSNQQDESLELQLLIERKKDEIESLQRNGFHNEA